MTTASEARNSQGVSPELWPVCFIGGTRYTLPLDSTSARKFEELSRIARMHVIAFSADVRPRFIHQRANFYLLPCLPGAAFRYLLMAVAGTLLVLWAILKHRVTIVVAQSPYEAAPAAWATSLARLFGRQVALVVESHGDFEASLFKYRRVLAPWLYRAVMFRVAKFSLSRADAVRAVSHSTRRQLEAWQPGVPCVQFPTWTDLEVFLKAGDSKRPDRATQLLVCAAALTPLKGVHVLLEAMRLVADEYPRLKLQIIGNAVDARYVRTLKTQAQEAGLGARVMFSPSMPQRQLSHQIAEADLFVLPSFSEGLPRVVFEAMACGTPVIASNVSGIPELIISGETGLLVPPGDAESLAAGIRWALDHPAEAQAMGQKAREVARLVLPVDRYVEGYARLFALSAREAVSRDRSSEVSRGDAAARKQ